MVWVVIAKQQASFGQQPVLGQDLMQEGILIEVLQLFKTFEGQRNGSIGGQCGQGWKTMDV